MQHRQSEYGTYLNMLRRHDSRAANREWQVLLRTDPQIAARTGGYAPPASAYRNPYGYSDNNGYYGNNPMGALGALVGPLFGMTP